MVFATQLAMLAMLHACHLLDWWLERLVLVGGGHGELLCHTYYDYYAMLFLLSTYRFTSAATSCSAVQGACMAVCAASAAAPTP